MIANQAMLRYGSNDLRLFDARGFTWNKIMKKHADPGIDEVRAARMEISARYGHDIDRMLADHMKQQERFADRLIRLAPVRKPTARRKLAVAA